MSVVLEPPKGFLGIPIQACMIGSGIVSGVISGILSGGITIGVGTAGGVIYIIDRIWNTKKENYQLKVNQRQDTECRKHDYIVHTAYVSVALSALTVISFYMTKTIFDSSTSFLGKYAFPIAKFTTATLAGTSLLLGIDVFSSWRKTQCL